jgi:cytoskeletal protein CcmA (bactofilin family)
MWQKKEVGKSESAAEQSPNSGISTAPNLSNPRDANVAVPAAPKTTSSGGAMISRGIRIKGEVTGSEDLFIDGHLEGKLNLTNDSKLTVGPNGEVKADVFAREVIVLGRVDGKIVGRERIQLGSTGNVAGDLQTERLAIEDGAVLRGKIEIETGKPIQVHSEARGAAAGASGKAASATLTSGTTAS